MDFEFTLGLGDFESSLKRKKSFLIPKNKGKIIKQTGGFEIDLNVHASEYDLFQFNISTSRVILVPTMHL